MDGELATALQRARSWVTGNCIPFFGPMLAPEVYPTLSVLEDVAILRTSMTWIQPIDQTGTLLMDFGPLGVKLTAPPKTELRIPAAPLTPMGLEVMSLLIPERDEASIRGSRQASGSLLPE